MKFKITLVELIIVWLAYNVAELHGKVVGNINDADGGTLTIVDIEDENKTHYYNQNYELGHYNYGYDVKPAGPVGQFHHENKSPDEVVYGCYGYEGPDNKNHMTFYISDAWGFRPVRQGESVEIFYPADHPEGHEHGHGHEHHTGTQTKWEDLFFPEMCANMAERIASSSNVVTKAPIQPVSIPLSPADRFVTAAAPSTFSSPAQPATASSFGTRNTPVPAGSFDVIQFNTPAAGTIGPQPSSSRLTVPTSGATGSGSPSSPFAFTETVTRGDGSSFGSTLTTPAAAASPFRTTPTRGSFSSLGSASTLTTPQAAASPFRTTATGAPSSSFGSTASTGGLSSSLGSTSATGGPSLSFDSSTGTGAPSSSFGSTTATGGPSSSFGSPTATGGPSSSFGSSAGIGAPSSSFGSSTATGAPASSFGSTTATGGPSSFDSSTGTGAPSSSFGSSTATGAPSSSFGSTTATGGPSSSLGSSPATGRPSSTFGSNTATGGPSSSFGSSTATGAPSSSFGSTSATRGPFSTRTTPQAGASPSRTTAAGGPSSSLGTTSATGETSFVVESGQDIDSVFITPYGHGSSTSAVPNSSRQPAVSGSRFPSATRQTAGTTYPPSSSEPDLSESLSSNNGPLSPNRGASPASSTGNTQFSRRITTSTTEPSTLTSDAFTGSKAQNQFTNNRFVTTRPPATSSYNSLSRTTTTARPTTNRQNGSGSNTGSGVPPGRQAGAYGQSGSDDDDFSAPNGGRQPSTAPTRASSSPRGTTAGAPTTRNPSTTSTFRGPGGSTSSSLVSEPTSEDSNIPSGSQQSTNTPSSPQRLSSGRPSDGTGPGGFSGNFNNPSTLQPSSSNQQAVPGSTSGSPTSTSSNAGQIDTSRFPTTFRQNSAPTTSVPLGHSSSDTARPSTSSSRGSSQFTLPQNRSPSTQAPLQNATNNGGEPDFCSTQCGSCPQNNQAPQQQPTYNDNDFLNIPGAIMSSIPVIFYPDCSSNAYQRPAIVPYCPSSQPAGCASQPLSMRFPDAVAAASNIVPGFPVARNAFLAANPGSNRVTRKVRRGRQQRLANYY